MKHVEKLLRRLGNATAPFEGVLEGKHVFIKTPNSNWGNKVLVNELIGLELAKLLHINIPSGGICIIDNKTNKKDVEEDLDYDEDIDGICFYSERIEKSNPFVASTAVIKHIINKEEINRIILFDHLIYNEDRHNGNILIQNIKSAGGLLMYIIDHSHIFNLKHSWNKEKLNELIEKCDYKSKSILEINWETIYSIFLELDLIDVEILREEAERFNETINRDELIRILYNIPESWNIKKDDINGVIEYILYRLEHIDDIIEMISEFIKTRGGV